MSEEQLIEHLLQGILLVVLFSSIILLPLIIVGFICSFVQAATQIQEQSLNYFSKLLTFCLIVYFAFDFLQEKISEFYLNLFLN